MTMKIFLTCSLVFFLALGCSTLPQKKVVAVEDDGVVRISVSGYSADKCENEEDCRETALAAAEKALQGKIVQMATERHPKGAQGKIDSWYLLDHLTVKRYERKVATFTLLVNKEGLDKFLEENIQ